MGSLYLSGLGEVQIRDLKSKLWKIQNGKCFICDLHIDLSLQHAVTEIDHVVPIKTGGNDDPSNFALTHSSCNRSKQATDLRVARIIARFNLIREECLSANKSPNLDDILQRYDGSKYELNISASKDSVRYSFPELGDNSIYSSYIYEDKLSGFRYFFGEFPISEI